MDSVTMVGSRLRQFHMVNGSEEHGQSSLTVYDVNCLVKKLFIKKLWEVKFEKFVST